MKIHRLATAVAAGLFLAGMTQAAEVAPAGGVLPLVIPAEQKNADIRAMQGRIGAVLQKQVHYLLTLVHPWKGDPALLLLTDSKSTEHWIRPNTGAVEAMAFLVRFGPYDEKAVGVPRAKLLSGTILPMMRYLVATHATGTRPTSDGKPWGNHWQSAHWTQNLGRAAWYVWADLPPDLRDGVRRVVAHEADRIAALEPPHQVLADTKAEENAWNSQVLSVAVLLMPADARRAKWEKDFQKWALSSFLRQADAKSTQIVDGRTVAEQFTGANIYDDFTLENHNIVHPDYMGTFSMLLGCVNDFRLSGRREPQALFYNAAQVYENIKWLTIADGSYCYPNGQDWEVFRVPSFLVKHVQMAVLAGDPDAWSLARTALEVMEKMQARSSGGAVYYPGEYFFPSTQTDVARAMAVSWLTLQGAAGVTDKPIERRGVRRFDAGKIILNRTGPAVHTFSWGARVMAQAVPLAMDRLVSPDMRSAVGRVRMAGDRSVLPVKVADVKVTSAADRFEADLVLDHGKEQVRAVWHFASEPDGTWRMREKLTALADVTTAEIATGLIGVLNNPHWVYERGERRVALGDRVEAVPAESGKMLEGEAATAAVDGRFQVRSAQPLHLRYVAATKADRGRATDLLILNSLPGERKWAKGQTISEFEVTVRCVAP